MRRRNVGEHDKSNNDSTRYVSDPSGIGRQNVSQSGGVAIQQLVVHRCQFVPFAFVDLLCNTKSMVSVDTPFGIHIAELTNQSRNNMHGLNTNTNTFQKPLYKIYQFTCFSVSTAISIANMRYRI
jgi:hypothetical protein